MDYTRLIQEAADYVATYMDQHDLSKLGFHDGTHVQEAVAATREIAGYYNLNEEDTAIVVLAAYFHDLGYCADGKKEGHEERSADLAEAFLAEKGVDQRIRAQVRACILATRMPQEPKSLLEEIVCDADLFHLGSDGFGVRNRLMRQEAKACGFGLTKSKWRESTLELMRGHRYHTAYGKTKLEPKKQQNIAELQKEVERSALKDLDRLELDKNKKSPGRGVETMFRITSTNNQRLSDMADNKSNILITVNSIILSVVIALLLRKLDNNVHLVFPTAILLLTSLATMVVAILATRPAVPNGQYTDEELKNKKVNLLFFGNFYKMDLKSYSDGMKLMMEEQDYLYSTLIKDVYSQGVVLGRKFKALRLAYNIFMYGLVVSVVTFLAVVYLNA